MIKLIFMTLLFKNSLEDRQKKDIGIDNNKDKHAVKDSHHDSKDVAP